MTKKRARHPRRRSLLENVFDDVSDLFQDLKQELHTPSEREQMWEVIDKRLGEVEGAVRGVQEQGSLDRQAILDALTLFVDRLDTVEQSLKPEEISRWKALLHRFKDLILFLAGAVAAGAAGALPQKLVEDGAYQPFREKLQELADYVDQTVLKWDTPSVVASGGLEPELILIPAGPFLMGSDKRRDSAASDRELPQHEVYLDDFYIARHPITNTQYRRFVEMTGHRSPWRDGYDVRKAEHRIRVFVRYSRMATKDGANGSGGVQYKDR